ncbi:MAG: hypothetical protein LBK44_05460 [Spirochaetales bacterium]|nr:hypothetical protein [Spirochaetales bacterium]
MQILWAFRYNPLRIGSSRQGPAIAGARNCPRKFRSSNPAVAIWDKLRDVPPSTKRKRSARLPRGFQDIEQALRLLRLHG